MYPEYKIETFERIMNLEESRGKLKDFCYSKETKKLSQDIKSKRLELKGVYGEQRENILQSIDELNQQYEEKKKKEIVDIYKRIINNNYSNK